MNLDLAKWIPWLPALGAVLCGLCCLKRSLRRWAAAICIVTIASGFIISFAVQSQVKAGDQHDLAFANWIHIGTFNVGFSYLVDSLTIVMLLVVTGIGTLVAIYAAGYMAGDRGYARFFAAVCLFIFTMTTLVMADNLVLLYLGWEGVGLCSYLLIGFHFHRPAAVAAAKKSVHCQPDRRSWVRRRHLPRFSIATVRSVLLRLSSRPAAHCMRAPLRIWPINGFRFC